MHIKKAKKLRMVSTGAFCVLGVIGFLGVFPITKTTDDAEATVTPATTTLTMTSSSTTASVDVKPMSSNGTFATSAAADEVAFTVTTNNVTGYNLTIAGSDNTRQLNNADASATLDSITAATDQATFTTGAAATYSNKWGYKPSMYNSAANTDYLQAPTTTAETLNQTTSANTTADTYTIGLGARVDYTKPIGTYTNTFVIEAVANNVAYQINYLDNSGGTVTGLPAAEGSSIATASAFTLASGTPARSGYSFQGWCYGTADYTTNPTGCTGTTYQAGDNFVFTSYSSASTNTANLYAMWEQDALSLYDTIASMSKGTQTAAQLQAAITVPTSADRTLDTSNSGVYEYNSSVFGAATDASNDYKIYYYRGVLENSVGTYGSDGSAVTYPNYVRLGGNSTTSTCWRILRTTGSGGIKMIYNGLWTGSTCANATTAAQFPSTSAFDTTANNSGKSIVGVGYMYNASYKSTTTSTQAGTLFGTNSSFAGNTTNSTIKGNIDTWYTSNLSTTYGSHLESSAGFCGDRSVNSGSSWTTYSDTTSITTPYTSGSSATAFYFGSYMRNRSTAQTPSLGCPRNTVDLYTTSSASNGNKKLTNPIALITADEASFAGSGASTATQGSSYHANAFLRSGSSFWLLSPGYRGSGGYARVFYLSSGGNLSNLNVYDSYGVRPAISLTQGTQISSGSGTATDPWEVTW